MLLCLGRQMVRLVDNDNALLGLRQYDAPAKAEIREQQVLVGDNHPHAVELVARLEKRALQEELAAVVGAAAMIGRHLPPGRFIDALRPAVQLAVPTLGVERIEHFPVYLGMSRITPLFGINTRNVGGPMQAFVEALEAGIASPSLGKRKVEVETGVFSQVRQVAHDDLLLQRDGCACDNYRFLKCSGDRYGCQAIGRRLARARTRFDGCQPRRGTGAGARDGGDHLPLAPARAEPTRCKPGAVGTLDVTFQPVGEQGHGAASLP